MLNATTNKPATRRVLATLEKGKTALEHMVQAIVLKDSGENALVQAFETFRKANITLGFLQASKTVPACKYAIHFRDTLIEQVSPKTGKKYEGTTASNYLVDFRKALENGGELVLNSARAEAIKKAKAEKAKVKPEAVEAVEAVEAIPSATPKSGAQKLYGTLNTALLIAQNDENPTYDVVKFTKQLNALIAMLPAS